MKIVSSAATEPKHVEFLSGVLPQIPIFAPLNPEQIRMMLYFTQVLQYEPGEDIIKRGEEGDTFYVIHAGKVEAWVDSLLGKDVIREMGPGDFFGELALLLDQLRSANVTCLEKTFCYRMDRSSFLQLIEKNPEIGELVKTAARERFNNYL